jgi:hypothetical protein
MTPYSFPNVFVRMKHDEANPIKHFTALIYGFS